MDSNKFETQIDSQIHSNDLFNDSVRTIYSQIARKAQKGNASVQNPQRISSKLMPSFEDIELFSGVYN